MELPNEEVAGGAGGDTKTIAEEEESSVNPIFQILGGVVSNFDPVLAKIRAILIYEGEAIEPGNGCLRYLEGVCSTTKSVRHSILTSRSMSKGEGVVLQCLHPSSVPST